jgi:hypothetical protein
LEELHVVDERITDGRRIGQLLASELSGLDIPPLDGVEIVDATPDAEPSATGTQGYRLQYRDQVIAVALLYPEQVVLSFDHPSISSCQFPDSAERSALRIRSGREVKRAVDTVRTVLERADV